MQLLVQWLRGPSASPPQVKSGLLAALQQPGVGVARSYYEEICQCTKRFLGSRGERAEGLALLSLVLDHIPDGVLSRDIVHFMKQLITLSANELLQSSCFTLLHRLLLRLRSLKYIQRDINTEVFPSLVQMLTRKLAVVPAPTSLLALTRATFSQFTKMCLPNRDQFERFLLKQLVAADRHDVKSGQAVVNTLAALSQCYVDPSMRHDVQSKQLDMLVRSCLLTEQVFLAAGTDHCDPSQLQNTIYAVADEPLFPVAAAEASGVSAHAEVRMVLWKRLLLQLDAVEALLASPNAKDIHYRNVLALMNHMVMCASADEHLLFLRPTLILRAIRIARQLVAGVRTRKMILVNGRLADFFLHVLEITHQTDPVDLSMLRADVFETMAMWIRNMSPSALLTRGEALVRIVNMTANDIAAACDPDTVVSRVAEERCAGALAMQRAIVLVFGGEDSEVVRQILLKLIPATMRLTRPLLGALLSSAHCRRRLYDLLAAFVVSANPSLMPPTAEITDVVREGLCDDVYEVREACDVHYRILCNTLLPLECGFSLSYSHAMNEHNLKIRRLELTRYERTRSAEVQTDDGTMRSPSMSDKAVSVALMPITAPALARTVREDEDDDEEDFDEDDDLSDQELEVRASGVSAVHGRRQAFNYVARTTQQNRPAPRSVKKRRTANALEESRPNEAIHLNESLSEDEDMMDDDEIDDDQMEMGASGMSSFRARGAVEETAAVIIADDDDDDDDLAITDEAQSSAITATTARVVAASSTPAGPAATAAGVLGPDVEEGDPDEEMDDGGEDFEDDEGDDEEALSQDVVCVIEDEDEAQQSHRRPQLQQQQQQPPPPPKQEAREVVNSATPKQQSYASDEVKATGVTSVVIGASQDATAAGKSVRASAECISVGASTINGVSEEGGQREESSREAKPSGAVLPASSPANVSSGRDQDVTDSGKTNGGGENHDVPRVNGDSMAATGQTPDENGEAGEGDHKKPFAEEQQQSAEPIEDAIKVGELTVLPVGPEDDDDDDDEEDDEAANDTNATPIPLAGGSAAVGAGRDDARSVQTCSSDELSRTSAGAGKDTEVHELAAAKDSATTKEDVGGNQQTRHGDNGESPAVTIAD